MLAFEIKMRYDGNIINRGEESMRLKRFLCALFALMLVGVSITNAAATFAEEPTGDGDAAEVAGTAGAESGDEASGEETSEGGEVEGEANNNEVNGNEANDGEVAGGVESEEVAEPATVENESSQPVAGATAVNLRGVNDNVALVNDGAVSLLAAEPTIENPTYEMELTDGSKIFNVDGWDSFRYRYNCSVAEDSGLTCETTNSGIRVTASEAGEYTVNIRRRGYNPGSQYSNWRTVTVAVYNLDVTFPDGLFYVPGDTVEYSISDDTFGKIHTTVSIDGEVVDEADGFEAIAIDTSSEGVYSIEVVNTSYPTETLSTTFFVVNMTQESIAIARGETATINSESAFDVDFAFDLRAGEPIEVVDGAVTIDTTEMELGIHPIEFLHVFDGALISTLKYAFVVIYDINAIDGEYPDEDYVATADTLKNLLDEYLAADTEEAWEAFLKKAEEVFGETYDADAVIDEEEYEESDINMFLECVYYGCEMTTGASVEELDEADVDEALVAKMAELGATNVKYYDITAWAEAMYEDELVWSGQLHQLDDKIIVAVPYDTTGTPADGYVRTYYVVRYHNGEVEELVEGEDFYIKDGVIYVRADKFSAYGVGYVDTLAPVVTVTTSVTSPNTGAATSEGASASSNMAVAGAVAMATVVLAGAAKFAKRK